LQLFELCLSFRQRRLDLDEILRRSRGAFEREESRKAAAQESQG
jgi:hypothetical protein